MIYTIGIPKEVGRGANMPVERSNLHIGSIISFTAPGNNLVLHGSVIHVGLGLAARNAVWIRCLDGYGKGKICFVMLEQIIGVTLDAS